MERAVRDFPMLVAWCCVFLNRGFTLVSWRPNLVDDRHDSLMHNWRENGDPSGEETTDLSSQAPEWAYPGLMLQLILDSCFVPNMYGVYRIVDSYLKLSFYLMGMLDFWNTVVRALLLPLRHPPVPKDAFRHGNVDLADGNIMVAV